MTPDALSHLATAYWPAATLIAAVELRVFDALGEGQRSASDLAAALATEPEQTAALLDALVAIDVLEKREDAYGIPTSLSALLCRGSPTCMLDALAYNVDLYRQWAGLAEMVRGRRPPHAGRQLGSDPVLTRRFVLGMEAKARAFAPALVEQIEIGGDATLLDVGAGPGTLSRLLAERYRTLSVTLLDLAAVLDVTNEVCAKSSAADRLTMHAADYRRDALPTAFDIVLYAGALHQETTASAAALLGKIRQSTRAGGRVYVVDLMLDDSRTSPSFSALFQLNMLLLRPGARVFSTSETVSLLRNVGLVDVHATDIIGTPYRVVTGRAERAAPLSGVRS